MSSSTGLSVRVAVPLAYAGWWVTGAILWFLERRNRTIRFHAAQAMTAFGLIALTVTSLSVLAVVSLSFLPAAFSMFVWAAALTWAGGVLLWLVVMWKAAAGDAPRIPVAADLAERLLTA